MKQAKFWLSVLVGGLFSLSLFTGSLAVNANTQRDETQSDEIIERQIIEGLSKGRPDLEYQGVSKTPVQGIYQVQVKNGPLLYSNSDGSYFIAGALFEVTQGSFVDLAEKTKAVKRKALFDNSPKNTTIDYKPAGEEKGYVSVFTDVNCPYCRKFHNELMPELLKLGVGVRYYAYPVIGREKSHKSMTSAWCAKDPAAALTALKNRREIEDKQCANSPVDMHLNLGQALQVSGTPSVFLPSGEKVELGAALLPTIAKAFGLRR